VGSTVKTRDLVKLNNNSIPTATTDDLLPKNNLTIGAESGGSSALDICGTVHPEHRVTTVAAYSQYREKYR